MDDRNLVAVAEQAAATSLVQRGPLAGCTVLADDGRHYRGCRLEFDDPADDLCPIVNAIAASRVDGSRRIVRAGYYTPTSGQLPVFPAASIRVLEQVTNPDFVMIVSAGSGQFVEKTLAELRQEASV
ncbi:MAG: hypothetical protein CMJ94_08785 [Planctomycetes bacterium]|nr:hypothetical protein [Planctomycetota bacterium]